MAYINNECHKIDHEHSIDEQVDRIIERQLVLAELNKPIEACLVQYNLNEKIAQLIKQRQFNRLGLYKRPNSSKEIGVLSPE